MRALEDIDRQIALLDADTGRLEAEVRDLEKIKAAMLDFPGVTAGEAVLLAGVELEVLTQPGVVKGGRA